MNPRSRPPVFSPETAQLSVLKVFNDFRNWNYRMAKLPGSYVSLSDSRTRVVIPEWSLDELKVIAESNRSMLGWALEFNQEADSHLVCIERDEPTPGFQTNILTGELKDLTWETQQT